jgi:hypothetical protein
MGHGARDKASNDQEKLSLTAEHTGAWGTGHGAERPMTRRNSLLQQNTLGHGARGVISGENVFYSDETHHVQCPVEEQRLRSHQSSRYR